MPRSTTTTSRTSTGNSAATTPLTNNTRSATLPAASSTPSRPTPSSRSSRLAALPADATTQSYRRARAGVWAVGVAIIAASGALLGAHLKTLYQEKERAAQAAAAPGGVQADILETTGRSNTTSPATATAQAQATSPTIAAATAAAAKVQQPAAPATPANSLSEEDRRLQIQDIERAIRTLDNQRGQLVTRRMQEEGRLGNLRERMRQKAELKRQREEIAGPER